MVYDFNVFGSGFFWGGFGCDIIFFVRWIDCLIWVSVYDICFRSCFFWGFLILFGFYLFWVIVWRKIFYLFPLGHNGKVQAWEKSRVWELQRCIARGKQKDHKTLCHETHSVWSKGTYFFSQSINVYFFKTLLILPQNSYIYIYIYIFALS